MSKRRLRPCRSLLTVQAAIPKKDDSSCGCPLSSAMQVGVAVAAVAVGAVVYMKFIRK